MNNDQITALFQAYPNIVTLRGDVAYDAENNEVAYDMAVVDAKVAALAYIGKRLAEYPSYAAQFDTLFHGGYDAWKAQIQAVKDKYPKE